MKIKRVLLVGHLFHGYIDSVSYALSKLSIDNKIVGYNAIWKGYNIIPTLYKSLKKRFLKNEKKIFLDNILKNSKNLDIMLFFRTDDILSPNDIQVLKSKTGLPTAIWLMDSFKSLKDGKAHCGNFDFIFCYNKEEEDYFKKIGKEAYFTPLSYDSRYYYKIENIKKDIDIYYVGSLSKRVDLLNDLFERLSFLNLNIRLDGKVSPHRYSYKLKLQNKYKHFFKYYKGKNVSHEQINLFTNRAKICLNIQPDQATSAFNIRTYEICGAGGFQITNGNFQLFNSVFNINNDLIYYKDSRDLFYIIKYYLNESTCNERNRISNNGLLKAKSNHSFIIRCKEIIKIIEENL